MSHTSWKMGVLMSTMQAAALQHKESYDLFSLAAAEPLTHSLFTPSQYTIPTSLCLTPVGSSCY